MYNTIDNRISHILYIFNDAMKKKKNQIPFTLRNDAFYRSNSHTRGKRRKTRVKTKKKKKAYDTLFCFFFFIPLIKYKW